MSLRFRVLSIVWLITAITLATFTWLYSDLLRSEYLNGVDNKLKAAAEMARAVMSENYHDKLENKDSVSEADYLKVIERYNRLCSDLGLQYIWSNLFLGDKVVFTSSTSTSKDVTKGDHALFFDEHSNPEAFEVVKRTQKTHYSTFTNEWGKGRMVLIPYLDIQNRLYVFGASISIDELDQKLYTINRDASMVFLVLLFIGTFSAIYITNKITRPIVSIAKVAKDIANGSYGEHTNESTNYPELAVLTDSINAMSDSILRNKQDLQNLLDNRTDRLIDNETYISEIINNMAEGVITIDERGIIENANPIVLELLGFEKHDLIGENISILVPPDAVNDHKHYLANPNTYLEQVHKTPRELNAKKKDGTIFPIELNISTMQTKEGRKYVGILHDITDRVKYEAVLKRAKQKAEMANKAKSEFLSNMSHELRTPLNAIIGFSQLIKMDDEIDEQTKTNANEIEEAGEHLLNLINDILDLSKIESGQLKISPTNLNLIGIIEQSIKLASAEAENSTVNIEFKRDGDLAVFCDDTRLKEVFVNLISNAIKYNTQGGSVRIFYKQTAPNKVRVSVEDTGRGIPSKRQEDIFKPFNRLGQERSNVQGTGIGLTITKKIVETMGGTIGFTSTENRGSTFWVDIPLGKTLDTSKQSRPPAAKEVHNDRNNQKPTRILYIEDNSSNIILMQRVVAKLPNFQLQCVSTAEEGIESIHDNPPNIILMDIDLPGMNGIEAINRIRQNSAFNEIPVIAVSAAVMEDDINRGMSAGFETYITKPINVSKLIDTLKEHQSA